MPFNLRKTTEQARQNADAAQGEAEFWAELSDLLPALYHHHTSRSKDASIGASARAYHAGYAKRLRALLGWTV